MSWLEAAFGLSDEPEPAAAPAKREPPKIESCWVVVRGPTGDGNYGSTVPCHYYVEGDALVICEPSGKAISHHRLAPGDDPKAMAKRIGRHAWHRENEGSTFHTRRLYYEPSGLR
jgi:hypothetical protein